MPTGLPAPDQGLGSPRTATIGLGSPRPGVKIGAGRRRAGRRVAGVLSAHWRGTVSAAGGCVGASWPQRDVPSLQRKLWPLLHPARACRGLPSSTPTPPERTAFCLFLGGICDMACQTSGPCVAVCPAGPAHPSRASWADAEVPPAPRLASWSAAHSKVSWSSPSKRVPRAWGAATTQPTLPPSLACHTGDRGTENPSPQTTGSAGLNPGGPGS